VDEAARQAGIKKHVSPHTLRHYLPFLTISCNAAGTAPFLVKF